MRGPNHYVGPAVRVSVNNFYFFHSAAEIQKMVAGSASSVGAYGPTANGDTMKLSCVGTALEVFVNGISGGGTTDASLTTGYAGIANYGNIGTLDDWEATGEVASGGGGAIVFNMQIG